MFTLLWLERSRAEAWNWALISGWILLLLNSCFFGHCLCDFVREAVGTALSGVHKLLHTGGGPHLLNILFGLYGSGHWDELLIGTWPPHPPPPPPHPHFPVPNKPYGFCGRKALWKREAGRTGVKETRLGLQRTKTYLLFIISPTFLFHCRSRSLGPWPVLDWHQESYSA